VKETAHFEATNDGDLKQEHCLRILSGLTLWPEAAAKLLHAGYIDCIIAAMLILGENQGNIMGISWG